MKAAYLLALLPVLAQAAAVDTQAHQLAARDEASNGISLDDITNSAPIDIDGLKPGDVVDTIDDQNAKYVGRSTEDNAQIFAFSNGDYGPIILDVADETDCEDCDAALAEAPAPNAEALASNSSATERSIAAPNDKRIIFKLLALKLDFIFGRGSYQGSGSHYNYWDTCRKRLGSYRGSWYKNSGSCMKKRSHSWWDFGKFFPHDVGFRCGNHRGTFRKYQPHWDGCGFGSTIGIDKGYYAGEHYGRHAWRHVGQSHGRYSYLSAKKGPRRHGYGPRPRGDKGNPNTCNVCQG